jgi:hypothetical protein
MILFVCFVAFIRYECDKYPGPLECNLTNAQRKEGGSLWSDRYYRTRVSLTDTVPYRRELAPRRGRIWEELV